MNETQSPVLVVGVVSDTHIPERAPSLHPQVEPVLREEGVQVILHAGDICAPQVLVELGKIAPVEAVRGNRDIFFRKQLKLAIALELGGVKVALMHGHGGLRTYWIDKVKYLVQGYDVERYFPVLLNTIPDARVVVFGHTHWPEMFWYNQVLLFNPGSASLGYHKDEFASLGVLRIYEGGRVEGKIVRLDKAKLVGRSWKLMG